MKHCKNQLTILITQYYCKTLSNCILEHNDLISGPLTEVIQTTDPKWCCVDVDEDRFMQIFGS